MADVGQKDTTQTESSPQVTTKRVVVLGLDDFRAHLKELAKVSGSNAELGRRLGVTGMFIDLLIAGKRKPGPKMLRAIGARKRVMIEIDLEAE